jgi:hypothetical protein
MISCMVILPRHLGLRRPHSRSRDGRTNPPPHYILVTSPRTPIPNPPRLRLD